MWVTAFVFLQRWSINRDRNIFRKMGQKEEKKERGTKQEKKAKKNLFFVLFCFFRWEGKKMEGKQGHCELIHHRLLLR